MACARTGGFEGLRPPAWKYLSAHPFWTAAVTLSTRSGHDLCATRLLLFQGPGAALPREVLVARCNNDERVLGFVLDAARRLGTDPDCAASAKAFLSFYAATLCEMVAGAKLVDEQLLSRLLPYISAGLEAGACSDYRAATLMVVAELAGRAKLGKDFVKGECAYCCSDWSGDGSRARKV